MKIKRSLISKGNFLRPMYVAGARNNKNGSVDREGRGHAQGKRPRAREENVYKSGVLAAWENSRHIATPLVVSPQLRLRNERRNSILMTYHYPDLGSASDWLEIWFIQSEALPRTTQIWVVTRHQYGISTLVPQTSFRGETSGGVAKRQLFSGYSSWIFSLFIILCAHRNYNIIIIIFVIFTQRCQAKGF